VGLFPGRLRRVLVGGDVLGQIQRLRPGKVSVCGSGSGSASASSLRGAGGARWVGSLRGTAVRGDTAVVDGGGELSMSGVGRIGALHPGMVSAPARVYSSATSRKGDGGGRQVGTRKGSAVRGGVAVRDGDELIRSGVRVSGSAI